MKPDGSHIKQIKVVCNSHWDREFRRSFEKTRHRLLTILDTTLDTLEKDSRYHSFTMDSHSIMLDDYLEIRPERRSQVEKLIQRGRLIISPWYTLPEQFSIGQEPLVRNLLWGRMIMEKYGAPQGSVAYIPASWGLTGQLPQILRDFGLTKMMSNCGISHYESDAEFIWMGSDGSCVLCSRVAIYARNNWNYQSCRPLVANGRVFEKDHQWGERDEVPVRSADGVSREDLAFDLKPPEVNCDKSRLWESVEKMVEREGPHYTTEIFLAMHGHDISAAHPLDAQMIREAAELFKGKYSIEQTDLESYWSEMVQHLDIAALLILTGERRACLRQDLGTFLFPGIISARTYLKQQDFQATVRLVHGAEPLASLASWLGDTYPKLYLDRGWTYLLANHTHDADGGCAPDAVCLDMEYRYRKVADVADIVTEDAMAYVAQNLSPQGQSSETVQWVVFNALPFERDAVLIVDLEIPRNAGASFFLLESAGDQRAPLQPILQGQSSSFEDDIGDVPTTLETHHIKAYALVHKLPPLGYRAYRVVPSKEKLRPTATLVSEPSSMENDYLKVNVNSNGTVDLLVKATGKIYAQLNYLSDQGESGNAWEHVSPQYDRKYNSLGERASIAVVESGPLVSVISAEFDFFVPTDCGDGRGRSGQLVPLPVRVEYRLECHAAELKVVLTLNNRAKDHWLRANFPSGLNVAESWADSHFDVLSRPIVIPDSTGCGGKSGGTHPLRTFVALQDGHEVIAVMPLGLFEYEVFDDESRTLALTLVRSCRIKLAANAEEQTDLPDPGVQGPGPHRFEYAIYAGPGNWQQAGLSNRAVRLHTPVRALQTARGKGDLPLEAGLFSVGNLNLQITCVKQAEDGNGLLVRLFNTLEENQIAEFRFGQLVREAYLCKMDESIVEPLPIKEYGIRFSVEPKKIRTFKFVVEPMGSNLGNSR
jgi:mannosylglycerate hydrolase